MIYTVTPNPALDYTFKLKELKIGQLNRYQTEQVHAGGKGINVSCVLNFLEEKSVPLGFVGGYTGDELEHILHQSGIWTDFVKVENGNTRLNVKVHAKEETELNGSGPLIGQEEIEQFMTKMDRLEDGDDLVLSGSLSNCMDADFYENIMMAVKNRDIHVIVDSEGEPFRRTLAYHPFLVKPNEKELEEITGKEIHSTQELLQAGLELKNLGVQNVLISRGKHGAVMISEDENIYMCGAPSGTVKGTMGCGDAMVAGFLAQYHRQKNYETAFYYAISSGSAWAFYQEKVTKKIVEEMFTEFLKDKR